MTYQPTLVHTHKYTDQEQIPTTNISCWN